MSRRAISGCLVLCGRSSLRPQSDLRRHPAWPTGESMRRRGAAYGDWRATSSSASSSGTHAGFPDAAGSARRSRVVFFEERFEVLPSPGPGHGAADSTCKGPGPLRSRRALATARQIVSDRRASTDRRRWSTRLRERRPRTPAPRKPSTSPRYARASDRGRA